MGSSMSSRSFDLPSDIAAGAARAEEAIDKDAIGAISVAELKMLAYKLRLPVAGRRKAQLFQYLKEVLALLGPTPQETAGAVPPQSSQPSRVAATGVPSALSKRARREKKSSVDRAAAGASAVESKRMRVLDASPPPTTAAVVAQETGATPSVRGESGRIMRLSADREIAGESKRTGAAARSAGVAPVARTASGGRVTAELTDETLFRPESKLPRRSGSSGRERIGGGGGRLIDLTEDAAVAAVAAVAEYVDDEDEVRAVAPPRANRLSLGGSAPRASSGSRESKAPARGTSSRASAPRPAAADVGRLGGGEASCAARLPGGGRRCYALGLLSDISSWWSLTTALLPRSGKQRLAFLGDCGDACRAHVARVVLEALAEVGEKPGDTFALDRMPAIEGLPHALPTLEVWRVDADRLGFAFAFSVGERAFDDLRRAMPLESGKPQTKSSRSPVMLLEGEERAAVDAAPVVGKVELFAPLPVDAVRTARFSNAQASQIRRRSAWHGSNTTVGKGNVKALQYDPHAVVYALAEVAWRLRDAADEAAPLEVRRVAVDLYAISCQAVAEAPTGAAEGRAPRIFLDFARDSSDMAATLARPTCGASGAICV